MFLRRLIPKRLKRHILHKQEVISVPRDEMDGEINCEDGPVDVEIATADEQDSEPVQGADTSADAARARNERILTPTPGNTSPEPQQANAEVHDEKIATVVPIAEDSNTTPDDVTREINRIRLPVTSEGDNDDDAFTVAASSSGMSRSTTLYVIYEVEQEHGITRSNDDRATEGWGADDLSATAASSSTEVHHTALHDVGYQRLSSVQPSVLALTAGQSTITTMSPYRNDIQDDTRDTREEQLETEEKDRPMFEFSKQLLIHMDHDKEHLEIDLFRPEGLKHIYPPHVLAPLCVYRKLHSLKIVGMMRSYQSYIWLVVWMNPYLSELTLETASEGEAMDDIEIRRARDYAKSKPTMLEVARGDTRATIYHKFPITKLSLSNFVVDGSFFSWFHRTKLLEVEIRGCKVPNDILEGKPILGLTNARVTIIP